jgi:fatty acid/phospholipid biosynthesis enzyme
METNTQEVKEQLETDIKEWLPNQFNYAASNEELQEIQERVQARFNNEELVSGIREGIVNSGVAGSDEEAKIQSAVALSIYMHTAYEIGRENALVDIDGFIENFLEAKKTEQEAGLKEKTNE